MEKHLTSSHTRCDGEADETWGEGLSKPVGEHPARVGVKVVTYVDQ